MNRLKLLVFALLALGLWGTHLSMATPALASKAVEQASLQVLGAPTAFAQRLEAARSSAQAAALKVASSPSAISKPTARPEAPNADRLNAARSIALETFAESDRSGVVVGLTNEAGSLMSTGSGEGAAAPEGFDAKTIGATGGAGHLVALNGNQVIFFSAPIFSVDKGEVKPVGSVFVGAPLFDSKLISEALTKDFHLTAFGIFENGKAIGGSVKNEQLDSWFKQTKAGQTAVVENGTVMSLGPAKLPLFTGGLPALEVAARKEIAGTPYEVMAVSSTRPFMQALADTQKTAFFMLAGLLVAAIAFSLIINNGSQLDDDDAPAVVAPRPVEIASIRKEPLGPLPLADAPAPAEASPDDFQFGGPLPRTTDPLPPPVTTAEQPAFVPNDGPIEDPFASAGPSPFSAPPPPLSLADDDFENQRTTAYPAHRAPVSTTDSHQALDPFAMAGGPSSDHEPPGFTGDFNPDATRVAAIPQELLNASRKQSNPDMVATRAMPAAPLPKMQPVAPVAGGPEEQHFHDTFRDFVATRERCGELADGLTYEKFAAKLRKNKEQLVAKYNCRTVRFQVYVKDGKAALKATPVKD